MDEKKKVLVAMSGGVDSTVAAAVLMQSYHVTGATMRLFVNDEININDGKTCCSLDDVEDARYSANKLGIEHYVFNFGERFKECVICPHIGNSVTVLFRFVENLLQVVDCLAARSVPQRSNTFLVRIVKFKVNFYTCTRAVRCNTDTA